MKFSTPLPVRWVQEVAFWVRLHQARVLPDGVIIGAQKAGSSALYWHLLKHPEIAGVVTRPGPWAVHAKEVHFFDYEENFLKGERWYRAQFPRKGSNKFVIEATPDYIYGTAVQARMHQTLPHARLVLSLRDPVERAYSHYRHLAKRGRVTAPFEQVLKDAMTSKDDQRGAESMIARGRYAEQIEELFTRYPREQVHVVDFREIERNPAAVTSGITRHFGLSDIDLGPIAPRNIGREMGRMDPQTERMLREYYEPHNRRLEALLGYSMGW